MARVTCHLCGHDKEFKDFYPKKSIYKCPSCGLVFAVIDENFDASKIYNSDYFHGGEYHSYTDDKPTIQENFKSRIEDLKKLRPSGKLLEIGCAYGYFLEMAAKHWDVVGVDIVEDGVKHIQSQGLDARYGDFLQLDFKDEKFDLICMWDTIEHLSRPIDFLKKAESLLSPGGHMILTTGNIDSMVSKMRGDKWRLIHPPSHLYYFSPKTLKTAFEGMGMEQAQVKHVGYSRYYKSMVHNILGSDKSLMYNVLTMGNKMNFPVYLNLYDIMMFVAKKA